MNNLFYGFFLICIATLFFSCAENSPQKKIPNVEPYKMKSGKMVDRFESAILNMEKEDSTRTIMEDEIIFVGSSSIRLWHSLLTDMLPLRVVNRGFGGSTIPEVTYYAHRIILPNKPPFIVFYCGENDINDGYSPEEVFSAFQKFDNIVHESLPKTKILFLSMKPSPDRWDLWDKFKKGNQLIENYCKSKPHLYYFDTSESLLTAEGKPDSTVFIEDGLHMNALGYEKWTNQLKPKLMTLMDVEEKVPAN